MCHINVALHQHHIYMNLSSAVRGTTRDGSSCCHCAAEGSARPPDRLSSASWDRYFCGQMEERNKKTFTIPKNVGVCVYICIYIKKKIKN